MSNSTNRGTEGSSFTSDHVIYVLSQPRSGSTLLQHMLGAHPKIATAPEPWLMLAFSDALAARIPSEARFGEGFGTQALTQFLALFENGRDVLDEGIQRAALHVYGRFAESSAATYFLDKTPRYFLILEDLLRAMTEAKIVILTRNPLAVLASTIETQVWGDLDQLLNADRRADLVQAPKILATALKETPASAHVRYEDLVQEPERAMERLCSHLGVDYSDAMVRYGERIAFPPGTFGDQKSIRKHRTPVDTYLDEWKRTLSSPNAAAVGAAYLTELGSEVIEALGYDADQLAAELRKLPLQNTKHAKPLVSVITPCLNSVDLLPRCIKSVEMQDYPLIEHIIVDGGSTDGTLDVLLEQGDKIRWISEPDTGQSHAINKGFRLARGDLITWLNADDELLPHSVAQAVETFRRSHHADVIYGDVEIVRGRRTWRRRVPTRIDVDSIFEGNPLAQPGTFIRSQRLRENATLDETLHLAMDFDLWVTLLRSGSRFAHTGRMMARFEIHEQSKSSINPPSRFLIEMAQVLSKHGWDKRSNAMLRRAVSRSAIEPVVDALSDANKKNPRSEALRALRNLFRPLVKPMAFALVTAVSPRLSKKIKARRSLL